MKPRVLFICTGNSARSQMAQGLLREMRGDLFDVFSAGTQPRGIHPLAVNAMSEQGVDISMQRSTPVDQFEGQSFDYVISLCDRAVEACGNLRGTFDTIHWSIDDPQVRGRLVDFKTVLKDIKTRLDYLVLIEEKRRKSRGSSS